MKKKNLCNYQPLFPMNLQFFADEGNPESDPSSNPEGNPEGNPDDKGGDENTPPTKTYEDAMAEIAAANAEAKKAKAERDAALKKSGELTKQLRAKMTEDELKTQQDEEEKAEREAHMKELEAYKANNEAFKRYTMQGMDAALAEKAAKAEIEGDMDALAAVFAEQKKKELKEAKEQWLGSRPEANKGDGEGSSMTKEEILAIKDPKERQEAIARNLNLFE